MKGDGERSQMTALRLQTGGDIPCILLDKQKTGQAVYIEINWVNLLQG